MKGDYNDTCNRSACDNTSALYFNHSTEKYYCKHCAFLINSMNRTDAMWIYGHDLCTLKESTKKISEGKVISVPVEMVVEGMPVIFEDGRGKHVLIVAKDRKDGNYKDDEISFFYANAIKNELKVLAVEYKTELTDKEKQHIRSIYDTAFHNYKWQEKIESDSIKQHPLVKYQWWYALANECIDTDKKVKFETLEYGAGNRIIKLIIV